MNEQKIAVILPILKQDFTEYSDYIERFLADVMSVKDKATFFTTDDGKVAELFIQQFTLYKEYFKGRGFKAVLVASSFAVNSSFYELFDEVIFPVATKGFSSSKKELVNKWLVLNCDMIVTDLRKNLSGVLDVIGYAELKQKKIFDLQVYSNPELSAGDITAYLK